MRKKFLFLATFFCVALFTFLCKPNLAFAEEEFVVNNNKYRITGGSALTLFDSSN